MFSGCLIKSLFQNLIANKVVNNKNCFNLIQINLINKKTYSSSKNNEKEEEVSDWKKDVVLQPIMTTRDDLLRKHKQLYDGFYINHRLYIDKTPEKYTIEPFKTKRTGGYDIETGTRLFRRVGGGLPITWYWVDFKRVGPKSGPPLVEKVIDIFASRDRTAFIALVAHGNSKRYILATENMKVGDLIRTYGELTSYPVKAYEGDAHPIGSLPVNTVIHNIEIVPGNGGEYCKAAGSSAILQRKVDKRCIVKLPHGQDISIDENCMVTVGQVSHASHKDEKLTHAVDVRDLGYRPRSGLWQRKDGRFGRKIKLPKPTKIMDGSKPEEKKRIPYLWPNWSVDK